MYLGLCSVVSIYIRKVYDVNHMVNSLLWFSSGLLYNTVPLTVHQTKSNYGSHAECDSFGLLVWIMESLFCLFLCLCPPPPTVDKQWHDKCVPEATDTHSLCCIKCSTCNERKLRLILPLSSCSQTNKQTVALSLQVNYTSWATITCQWNLVPSFVDRGVSRGRRSGSPTVVNLSFLDQSSSFILTRAEWTPFQTHCYSENLVALGIETGHFLFTHKCN
jgi:hypothetical protein